MMLDLAHLEDFLALAQTGNFSRAAVQRAVTQPAFSRRIRALEEWAGAPLFLRDAQPIGLTEAGRLFHPLAIEVVRDLKRGRDEIRALAAHSRSTLRFAATHVLSFTFFPIWLRGLEGGQPSEAVELTSDSLEACEQMMRHGQSQFLLCHHHPAAPVRLPEPDFPWHSIGGDVLCPVSMPDDAGHPRHDLTAGRPVPLLSYSSASGFGRILSATRRLEALKMEVVVTSHLAATLRSMALAGDGAAWLPRSLIDHDLAAGRLVPAGPTSLDVTMEIRLVRPAHNLTPAAEAFWTRLGGAPRPSAGPATY